MATALAPCPYCHSPQLHFVHHLVTHAVCCQQCGACGPSQRQADEAAAQWNLVAKSLQQVDALRNRGRELAMMG
ncbi:hypothetical protein R50072_30790 [Simiduia litorea]|uniref:Lar family restriction alleviation protein n=1 Tax=Simiduia litorea TaxID=1435348 RepID=UPI0036F3F3D6